MTLSPKHCFATVLSATQPETLVQPCTQGPSSPVLVDWEAAAATLASPDPSLLLLQALKCFPVVERWPLLAAVLDDLPVFANEVDDVLGVIPVTFSRGLRAMLPEACWDAFDAAVERVAWLWETNADFRRWFLKEAKATFGHPIDLMKLRPYLPEKLPSDLSIPDLPLREVTLMAFFRDVIDGLLPGCHRTNNYIVVDLDRLTRAMRRAQEWVRGPLPVKGENDTNTLRHFLSQHGREVKSPDALDAIRRKIPELGSDLYVSYRIDFAQASLKLLHAVKQRPIKTPVTRKTYNPDRIEVWLPHELRTEAHGLSTLGLVWRNERVMLESPTLPDEKAPPPSEHFTYLQRRAYVDKTYWSQVNSTLSLSVHFRHDRLWNIPDRYTFDRCRAAEKTLSAAKADSKDRHVWAFSPDDDARILETWTTRRVSGDDLRDLMERLPHHSERRIRLRAKLLRKLLRTDAVAFEALMKGLYTPTEETVGKEFSSVLQVFPTFPFTQMPLTPELYELETTGRIRTETT
jgi:hypothetical protein